MSGLEHVASKGGMTPATWISLSALLITLLITFTGKSGDYGALQANLARAQSDLQAVTNENTHRLEEMAKLRSDLDYVKGDLFAARDQIKSLEIKLNQDELRLASGWRPIK